MNLFGKKKEKTIDVNGAIAELNQCITMLQKREQFLDSQIEKLKREAKTFVQKKQKTKALHSIKRYKQLEKQINTIITQKLNMETQVGVLAQCISNKNVISAMKKGVSAMNDINVGVDEVSDIMDDLEDKICDLDEVSDMLGRSVVSYDEDELEREIKELMKEDEEETVNRVVIPPIVRQPTDYLFPEIPNNKIVTNKTEEDELRELEKTMSVQI